MKNEKDALANKSKCIKLYWECFLSKGFWSPSCSWIDCENMEENEEEIGKIRKRVLSRNPNAFGTKIKVDEKASTMIDLGKSFSAPGPKVRHIKGWTWKKSQWSNNYCECHQNGAKCSELCSCLEWKN